MKENSIKNERSSIEEYIKILENMNDGYTFKDCDICNNYNEKTKHCDKHKCMELQAIEHILSDYKRVLKENEIFKEYNMEYKRILDLADNRIYRKKYLEERRKDQPNLLYPDSDEIYQRYYELKRENEELKEYIMLAPNLDEMTTIKYSNIRRDAYIQGRAEEQQKAKQMIYENYISKEKIKNKIEELNKKEKKELKGMKGQDRYFVKQTYQNKRMILQELIKESEE